MKKIFLLCFIIIFFCGFSFFGNNNPSKKKLSFIKKNIKLVDKDPLKIKSSKKRAELVEKLQDLEQYSLQIDAGDIKNKRLRNKVISLRRNALKHRNKRKFIINNFDSFYYNRLGGNIGCEYRGSIDNISPWLKYEKVRREGRVGKNDFKFTYDVSEGEAFFFIETKKTMVFKHYNAFSLTLKGDIKALKIRLRLQNGVYYEGLINNIVDTEWNTFIIPFTDFYADGAIDFSKLERIEFVIDDDIAYNLRGVFFLREFSLIEHKDAVDKEKTVITYDIEGGVPLGTNTSLFQ